MLPRYDYTENSYKGGNNSEETSLSSAAEEIIQNPIDCIGRKLPKKWRNRGLAERNIYDFAADTRRFKTTRIIECRVFHSSRRVFTCAENIMEKFHNLMREDVGAGEETSRLHFSTWIVKLRCFMQYNLIFNCFDKIVFIGNKPSDAICGRFLDL